jgi:hypothetical protein
MCILQKEHKDTTETGGMAGSGNWCAAGTAEQRYSLMQGRYMIMYYRHDAADGMFSNSKTQGP